MPNWQPNWDNVRWNQGAADDAANAPRKAAEHLDSALWERLRLANDAQREWRGRYRDQFDVELERLARRANDLANDMRDAAARIRVASQRANEEQRRREAQRARWHDEVADEERARRSS